MIVRLATMDDVEQIYNIEVDCFSIPWSLESIQHELENSDKKFYVVIEDEDRLIGYGGAWLVADEGQITNIAVRKDYRRDGYGAMINRKIVKECFKRGMTEIFLEVRISNLAALALYRRLGFAVKGLRKDYYSEPTEDAYIMSLVKEEVE